MSRLHDLGLTYRTDKATFHGYLDFYAKHLPDPDEFHGRLLEIGVMDGNSLRMWRDYYPAATIIGVDIVDKTRLRIDGVTILKRDATDHTEMAPMGELDVIIDDGSHLTADQQISFNWLFYNQLAPGGIYVLEDLHTSYMSNYLTSRRNTVEFLEQSDLDITWYHRMQGEPVAFLDRHGFDTGRIEWTGNPAEAESITAIIRSDR